MVEHDWATPFLTFTVTFMTFVWFFSCRIQINTCTTNWFCVFKLHVAALTEKRSNFLSLTAKGGKNPMRKHFELVFVYVKICSTVATCTNWSWKQKGWNEREREGSHFLIDCCVSQQSFVNQPSSSNFQARLSMKKDMGNGKPLRLVHPKI